MSRMGLMLTIPPPFGSSWHLAPSHPRFPIFHTDYTSGTGSSSNSSSSSSSSEVLDADINYTPMPACHPPRSPACSASSRLHVPR